MTNALIEEEKAMQGGVKLATYHAYIKATGGYVWNTFDTFLKVYGEHLSGEYKTVVRRAKFLVLVN